MQTFTVEIDGLPLVLLRDTDGAFLIPDHMRGVGSALKPANEPICMARKPLDGTLGNNLLKHGTGAINVDGCRVGVDLANEPDTGSAYYAKRGVAYPAINSDGSGGETSFVCRAHDRSLQPLGRWPANLIHSGEPEVVAAFPKVHDAGSERQKNVLSEYDASSYHAPIERQMNRFGDSGSAARFFKTCALTEDDRQWQGGHESRNGHAINAGECLSLQSEAAVSALSHAVAMSAGKLTLQRQSYRAPFTTVTASELKLIAANVITAIQNIESASSLGLPQQKLSLTNSLAAIVAIPNPIGTITITISLLKSNGSAESATFDCIATNVEAGASGFAKRIWYSAKADSDDRLGSKHPTVKPVDLMQYLVRLVTPRGGTCLDPFAGTGTTAEACVREGMKAVLIEREAEYLSDIERRCSLILAGPDTRLHATIKAKGRPEEPLPLFAEARP